MPKIRLSPDWIWLPALLVISIILAAWLALMNWVTPPPKVIRRLGTRTIPLMVLWSRETAFPFQSADAASGALYVYSTEDHLMALKGSTGHRLWDRKLPVEEAGVRQLVNDGRSVFTVTATKAYAYDASTGSWLWSRTLGDGHVGIYAQMDNSILRVYYGTRIIELSPKTGEVLRDQENGNIEWVEGNVQIQQAAPDPASRMVGIDRSTGGQLWSNHGPFFVKLESFPIQSAGGMLYVLSPESGICAVDLASGLYAWCRGGEYISNMAISPDRKTGYALDSMFALQAIDLESGKLVGEVQFVPSELPTDLQSLGFDYSVSATKDAIMVSFGDSDQTFGFRFMR